MSASRNDYEYYGSKWLSKTDLRPSILKRYGIKVSQKEINSKSKQAITGYVVTGGRGYKKRVPTYSINKLKEIYGVN